MDANRGTCVVVSDKGMVAWYWMIRFQVLLSGSQVERLVVWCLAHFNRIPVNQNHGLSNVAF